MNEGFRDLPSVNALLEDAGLGDAVKAHGRGTVKRAIQDALEVARAALKSGAVATVDSRAVLAQLEQTRGTLVEVINATGVVIHTNLGRAPLASSSAEAAGVLAATYSNLELDLDSGKRGDRHAHARALLLELTGAEDACVVNNNAAAVFLALSALCAGSEVVVSRSELVEIGGSFRVPDICRMSGATLVEVGTTNRTRARDFEDAIGDDTRLLLKVHQSNFAIVGFTEAASLDDLVAVSRARGIPVMYDAGSGCLLPVSAAPEERPVRALIDAGVDLVSFSGDKLLGGPQAGLLVGKRALIERCRKHPLMRALRPDKMCFAALSETLRLWRDDPDAVPTRRMLDTSKSFVVSLAARGAELQKRATGASVVRTVNKIGGGSSPLAELEGRALALASADPEDLAARLRAHTPAVMARVEGGKVLLELRTVRPDDDEVLATAIEACTP